MPQYKCTNKECKNFDVVITKNTTIRVINGEVVDVASKCDECSNGMYTIPRDGYTTSMHGSDNICKK